MRESERIKKLARHYGSQANLAKRLGVGQSNVANWIKRGTLPSGAIRLIGQKCPEVSMGWLMTGKGDMIVALPDQSDLGGFTHGVMMNVVGNNSRKVSRRGIRGFGIRYTTPPDARVRVKPVGLREISAYQGDANAHVAAYKAYRKAKRFALRGGYLPSAQRIYEVETDSDMPIMPIVVSAATESKKGASTIGKRRTNEILNEALGKCLRVVKNDDGTIALIPYKMEEGSKMAVLPIEKEVDTYIKVDGFAMAPTINNGDVIGLAPTDWFERFSEKHIYTIRLVTGEILTRRIVPPGEGESTIKLTSDNPNEADLELLRSDISEIKRVLYIGKNL